VAGDEKKQLAENAARDRRDPRSGFTPGNAAHAFFSSL
jgi:hypothetical protein